MKALDKSLHLQRLYDFYGVLLTDKQRMYFEQYYFDDYSITELSENNEVSRNAVFDQLKRVESKLEEYELKLKLVEKDNQRNETLETLKNSTKDAVILQLIDKLTEIE